MQRPHDADMHPGPQPVRHPDEDHYDPRPVHADWVAQGELFCAAMLQPVDASSYNLVQQAFAPCQVNLVNFDWWQGLHVIPDTIDCC